VVPGDGTPWKLRPTTAVWTKCLESVHAA
jgi:hypothetical protein